MKKEQAFIAYTLFLLPIVYVCVCVCVGVQLIKKTEGT
jgi:hypothetical protein